MPAPEERIALNEFVKMTLQGVDDSSNLVARELLIRRDRALVIWSRLVGFNGTREQVIASDAQNLLRTRPYEPIFPVEPTILTGTLATVFTSTGARTRVHCDVANHANTNSVTVRVQHFVSASGQTYDWYPGSTPVLIGVAIRTGFKDLAPGDTLRASCSPSSTVTIHPIVDRYNSTGDTP
jgi:hypothetical protein